MMNDDEDVITVVMKKKTIEIRAENAFVQMLGCSVRMVVSLWFVS